MKAIKAISYLTAALVLFLAVGAFVLSYDALRGLALDNGVTPGLSWLWPLLIDGAIIVFSLAVLRGSLLGERVRYPWALVILFVILSIGFNIVHANDNTLARVIAAVPPVALALSFELFTGQVKAEVKRRSATLALSDLSDQVTERRAELDKIAADLGKLTAQRDALNAEIVQLKADKTSETPVFVPGDLGALSTARDTRQAQIAQRRETVTALLSEGMTEDDIAVKLGVSPRTIKRDVAALNGRVRESA